MGKVFGEWSLSLFIPRKDSVLPKMYLVIALLVVLCEARAEEIVPRFENVTDQNTVATIVKQHNEVAWYPSIVAAEEMEGASSRFTAWIHSILREEWLPPDMSSRVVGIRDLRISDDVVVLSYSKDGNTFRIRCDSTELIIQIDMHDFEAEQKTPPELAEYVKTNVADRFLKTPFRVEDTLQIVRIGNGFFRIDLHKHSTLDHARLDEEQHDKLIGPTVVWISGRQVTLQCPLLSQYDAPIHAFFGIRNWIGFEKELLDLDKYPSRDLVRFVTVDSCDKSAALKRAKAFEIVNSRGDSTLLIDPLLEAYRNADSTEKKIAIIQMLQDLKKRVNGAEASKISDFLKSVKLQKNPTILQSVLSVEE